MGSAVILVNGQFPRKEYPLYLLRSACRIVCCDGAVAKYRKAERKVFGAGRMPDCIIGDLDSIPKALLGEYSSIITRVEEQDDNDQTKAVRHTLRTWPDIDEIHILGATGLRADHTIGNLSLLMEYPRIFDLGERTIDIVTDYGTAFAVTDSCTLQVGEGRRFSLFSPDNSLRIKSEGLKWPTDEVVFDNWWKATLNRATQDEVTLTFSHPSRALVILD